MSPLILKTLLISIVAGQLIRIPIGGGNITLLDITALLACLYGLINHKLRIPKIVLPFLIIALLSFIFTPLHLSLPERLNSFLYLVRFTSIVLVGSFLKGSSKILAQAGIILAVLGLIQFVFIPDLGFLASQGWDPHYFRTASTFLDPNFLGAFLSLTLLLISKDKKYLLFAIVYIALLTTFSRGAYLAFLTSFLALAFLEKSAKLALVTIVLFSGLMLGFFGYQQLVAGPRGIDRTVSAEARIGTWQQGQKIFLANPILGTGFNTYKFALREYNLAGSDFLGSHGATSNDSSLLFVAATTGVLGLLAYLFWLFSLARIGYQEKPILLAGLVGLLTQSFFANTLFYPQLLIFMVLL